jgi:FkbM family methyltransferase
MVLPRRIPSGAGPASAEGRDYPRAVAGLLLAVLLALWLLRNFVVRRGVLRDFAKGSDSSLRFSAAYALALVSGVRVRGDVEGVVFEGNTSLPRCLHVAGAYEPSLTRLLLENVGPEDTFLDLGANEGLFSLLLAKKRNVSKAYAVEPSRRNLEAMRAHMKRNGIAESDGGRTHDPGAIEILPYAVGREGGTGSFREHVFNGMWSRKLSFRGNGSTFTNLFFQDVDVDFVAARDLPEATVIKVDIEGSECEIMDSLPMEKAWLVILETETHSLVHRFLDDGWDVYRFPSDSMGVQSTVHRPERVRSYGDVYRCSTYAISRRPLLDHDD